MLVRPRRISARRMYDAVNGICAKEIPGIHGLTAVERIARQAAWIDGLESAVEWPVRTATIQFRLIEVDALLVLCRRAVCDAGHAWTGEHAVSGVVEWRC